MTLTRADLPNPARFETTTPFGGGTERSTYEAVRWELQSDDMIHLTHARLRSSHTWITWGKIVPMDHATLPHRDPDPSTQVMPAIRRVLAFYGIEVQP